MFPLGSPAREQEGRAVLRFYPEHDTCQSGNFGWQLWPRCAVARCAVVGVAAHGMCLLLSVRVNLSTLAAPDEDNLRAEDIPDILDAEQYKCDGRDGSIGARN